MPAKVTKVTQKCAKGGHSGFPSSGPPLFRFPTEARQKRVQNWVQNVVQNRVQNVVQNWVQNVAGKTGLVLPCPVLPVLPGTTCPTYTPRVHRCTPGRSCPAHVHTHGGGVQRGVLWAQEALRAWVGREDGKPGPELSPFFEGYRPGSPEREDRERIKIG